MEKTFNINRFGKYFLYDLKSRWSELGIFFLVFALFPFIFYLIYMIFATLGGGGLLELLYGGSVNGPSLAVRFAVFAVLTAVFVIVFPARAYGFITDKKAGSDWLMLPASRGEKFFSMMLICLVVIPVVYLLGYGLSDWLLCLMDKSCGDSIALTNVNKLTDDSFQLIGNGIPLLLAWMVEYVSVFLLGSLIFKKWKTGYTILALFAINAALTTFFAFAMSKLDFSSVGEYVMNWIKDHAMKLDLYANLWVDAGLLLFVVGCGIWSWFRLKNQQH
ncbi:MAG: hypothetical protein J6Z47_00945 [Bacteroidales bacterium]|nr:hypothetical protein [Bacteroidales bacterium]